MVTVLMSKDDYVAQCNQLLRYEKTYVKLKSVPPSKFQTQV